MQAGQRKENPSKLSLKEEKKAPTLAGNRRRGKGEKKTKKNQKNHHKERKRSSFALPANGPTGKNREQTKRA